MSKYIIVIIVLLFYFQAYSQEYIGLWEVSKVKVGEKEMTPVSKWSKLNDDQSFQSGNGWLQHSIGTYNYDPNSSMIEFSNELGIKDEFGGFKVMVEDSRMEWRRMEHGEEVRVFLDRIETLPTAPQDFLIGIWELSKIIDSLDDGSMETENIEPSQYFYFRWDHEYRQWEGGTRSRGYWQMHAHQPVLTLIDEESVQKWKIIKVDKAELIVEHKSDSGIRRLHYTRKDRFPN